MDLKNKPVSNQNLNVDLSDESKSFQERIDDVRSLLEENLRYTKNLSNASGGAESAADKNVSELLEENLRITKQIQEAVLKINRWIAFQKVWGVVKTLIIIIPLILGLIYLPALLQNVIGPYQDLLKVGSPDMAGQAGLLDKVNELLNANQGSNQ